MISIRWFEKIEIKICKKRMSMILNQICHNEGMLPKHTHTHTHTHIYIYICIKLVTAVEDDPKAPYSIVTTLRCRWGRYFFPLYSWSVPYNTECWARRHQVPAFWVFGMTRPGIEPLSTGQFPLFIEWSSYLQFLCSLFVCLLVCWLVGWFVCCTRSDWLRIFFKNWSPKSNVEKISVQYLTNSFFLSFDYINDKKKNSDIFKNLRKILKY